MNLMAGGREERKQFIPIIEALYNKNMNQIVTSSLIGA